MSAKNSSSLIICTFPAYCAFSNLAGPIFSPARIKLVLEEMLPTFLPPCLFDQDLYIHLLNGG